MKLLTPHYFILALTAIAAALIGVSHVPSLSDYAGTLDALAGVCTGLASMLGVTSHSAINPALNPPPTPGCGAPPPNYPPAVKS